MDYGRRDDGVTSPRETGLSVGHFGLSDGVVVRPEEAANTAEMNSARDRHRWKNAHSNIMKKHEHMFHAFVENTTLHGVKYVTNHAYSKTRRSIWMFLFLSMVMSVSIASYLHCEDYFQYKTKTALVYKSPGRTSFPSIYLCNCASLSGRSWGELQKIRDGVAVSDQGWDGILQDVPDLNGTEESEGRVTTGDIVRDRVLEHSQDFKPVLLGCWWAEGAGSCSAANFTPVWTDLGVCHVFNGNDESSAGRDRGLMADDTGIYGGLWVRLRVEQSQHSTAYNTGNCFKVGILPRGEVHYMHSIARTVSSGSQLIVGLRKRVRKSMMAPYDTNCRKDGLKYYDTFFMGACRMECVTDYTMGACGCIAPYMPASSNCTCETPCTEVMYDERVSNARAPSFDHDPEVPQLVNSTREQVFESILEVSVFFEDLREEWAIQLPAHTFPDLLSSVGGMLGLCLGGSVLTVFEFFDFFICKRVMELRWFRSKRADHPA